MVRLPRARSITMNTLLAEGSPPCIPTKGLHLPAAAFATLVLVSTAVIGVYQLRPTQTLAAAQHANEPQVSIAASRAIEKYARLPMAFEPAPSRPGQAQTFIARSHGYMLAIGPGGTRLAVVGQASAAPTFLDMVVVGASPRAKLSAEDKQPGLSHYLLGNDPGRYAQDVRHYSTVVQREVYPGIDLVYRGEQRLLEYDFVVTPGADPRSIRLRFSGHDGLSLSPAGDLVFRVARGELRQRKPKLYELPDRRPVDGAFHINNDGTVGFLVSEWDRSKTLVIDPILTFGTYLGGSGVDTAQSVAVDSSGSMYVGGTTASANFPTEGGYQGSYVGGSTDAFVTKLDATGTLVYSTFLGGSGADEGRAIVVDADGSAYLAGQTGSTNFPHPSAASSGCLSTDGFLTKLTPAGSALEYSLCIGAGGTDAVNGVALDSTKNAYVTGLNGGSDASIGKLNPAGSAWLFFNTIGGTSIDEGMGIGADAAGNTCIAGSTSSSNFPVSNAKQPTSGGGSDAFVAKFNPSGGVVYATYPWRHGLR